MTPETYDLFRGVVSADPAAVERALAGGADVNATDELGRNVLTYASLGTAINSLETTVQPRLSERRLKVLQLVAEHPEHSLYSFNAPMPWVGGVTLLGLMAWLNMSSEIMCLLEFTQGLLEVNAMDEHGATPLMYAARDGNLQVVRRLLAHGARPDLRDVTQRSVVQYSLSYPEIQWLCEETLRRCRVSEEVAAATHPPRRRKYRPTTPFPGVKDQNQDLFYSAPDSLLSPPASTWFDAVESRRGFDMLLKAIRSEDSQTLQKGLFTTAFGSDSTRQRFRHPGLHGTPILVNFRDSAGLSLLHHAVSQGRTPNIEVVDALHNAGADMGLYSTLGFTPLHHLARKTKEDEDYKDVPVYKRPLYTFTMHLIEDLHAPLAATDNRGETPLHAAAEHGRSISVLQAMLDCDKAFFGKESVRESRNERGLRPMDVAKPEFLQVFLGDQSMPCHIPPLPGLPPPVTQISPVSPAGVRPLKTSRSFQKIGASSQGLGKKSSTTSLMSKSSGSSSESSGIQSSLKYQQSLQRRKTSFHSLPTPDPTPPGSFAGSPATPSGPGLPDIQNSTMDILYNLSFCASAIHSYSQARPEIHPLPDVEALLDNLEHTRLLTSHVIGYWGSKFDAFQSELNRTRVQLEKAQTLRMRVGKDVRAIYAQSERPTRFVDAFRLGDNTKSVVIPVRNSATPTAKAPNAKDFQRASDSTEKDKSSKPNQTSATTEVETGPAVSGETTRLSAVRFPEADPGAGNISGQPKRALSRPARTSLRSAPRVLDCVDLDLERITTVFSYIQDAFAHAEDLLIEATTLAEDAISAREGQLEFLRRLYHGRSSRLSPIQERASEGGHGRPLSTPSDEMHSIVLQMDEQYNPNALSLIEEPHMLRHILSGELEKYVDGIFLDLQKAHVWLRIVREVLRGLRRRILMEH